MNEEKFIKGLQSQNGNIRQMVWQMAYYTLHKKQMSKVIDQYNHEILVAIDIFYPTKLLWIMYPYEKFPDVKWGNWRFESIRWEKGKYSSGFNWRPLELMIQPEYPDRDIMKVIYNKDGKRQGCYIPKNYI